MQDKSSDEGIKWEQLWVAFVSENRQKWTKILAWWVNKVIHNSFTHDTHKSTSFAVVVMLVVYQSLYLSTWMCIKVSGEVFHEAFFLLLGVMNQNSIKTNLLASKAWITKEAKRGQLLRDCVLQPSLNLLCPVLLNPL